MTTFGEVLDTELRRRGISQFRFALQVGVDHSYISRLLAGTRHPSPEMVLRIVEALGIAPDEREVARFLVLALIPGRYQPLLLAGLAPNREDADELWQVVSRTLTEQWQRRREAA